MLPMGQPLFDWHHYKPGEHLHYCNQQSILKWLRTIRKDAKLWRQGTPECPPRLDIQTFTFELQGGA